MDDYFAVDARSTDAQRHHALQLSVADDNDASHSSMSEVRFTGSQVHRFIGSQWASGVQPVTEILSDNQLHVSADQRIVTAAQTRNRGS